MVLNNGRKNPYTKTEFPDKVESKSPDKPDLADSEASPW